jgi:tryptophan-specific transport protein
MNTNKPLWHGIFLVAGGALGAGMFALPMVSAGAWFLWSIVGFIWVWFMTYIAASLLVKVNLLVVANKQNNLNPQSSFSSLVEQVLGKRWAVINNISVVFIMMILMYAYTSAGASIVNYSLESFNLEADTDLRGWFSLIFATTIALIVWLGTSIVSQIILILMVAMAITFGVATFGIVPKVSLSSLTEHVDTSIYLLAALPVYVTAFACAGLVPSLVRHYYTHPKRITQSLLYGTLLALIVYIFWLVVTLGSISRDGFIDVLSNGGNLAELVKALVEAGATPSLQARLNLFSHCAIITSYLSIGLGLLHFMQDKLALGNNSSQRFTACVYCFLPPAIASFALPYGFVHAISYAGLFVAFSFFILPGVMAIVLDKKQQNISSSNTPRAVILFGLIIVILKVALILSVLPVFG